MPSRSLLTLALAACLFPIWTGCMMVTGEPRIEGRTRITPADETPPASGLVVNLAVTTSTFQDGIHVRLEEYMQELVLRSLLGRAFREAGYEVNHEPTPSPEAVQLFVQAEEDRAGPIGLRILSTMTFRAVPAWETIRFRVQAEGAWRGRPLPRFVFEVDSTKVDNVLLLPVAPFFSPVLKNRNQRREAVKALVQHVQACLAGDPPRTEESRS